MAADRPLWSRNLSRETVVNLVLLGSLLIVPVYARAVDDPFLITLSTRVAILALAGVGLNLALGLGGLVSLGHAAFFGIGGYTAGILASHALNYAPLIDGFIVINGSRSMPVIWVTTLIVSACLALLIGALSVRTTGVYFIMITLAFGQMMYYFSISWPAYGGEDGLPIAIRNEFPGLNSLDPFQFFLIAYAVLCVTIFLISRLQDSAFGLALNAARQSARRVEMVGIATFRLRLTAFVLSGMITGLAGALFADLNRFVSPSMFSWQTSGEIMIFVILGGTARLCGPVAGAGMFIILEHLLGGISDYWLIFLGLLLLVVVLFAQGGLVSWLAGERVRRHG